MRKPAIASAFIAAVLCALLLVPKAAQATVTMSVTCRAGNTTLTGTTLCNNPSGNGHSVATAYGAEGVIKSSASTNVSGGYGSSRSSSFVRISDYYIIDSPGKTGQRGSTSTTPHYNYSTSIAIGSGMYSGANVSSIFSMGNVSTVDRGTVGRTLIIRNAVDANGSHYNEYLYGSNNGVQVDYNAPMTVSWDFIYGAPIYVTIDLSIGGEATYDGSAAVDATHSFYWGGLSVAGLAPGEFTVTSGSGTDWARSFVPFVADVPEPETFFIGLALVALVRLFRPGRSNIPVPG